MSFSITLSDGLVRRRRVMGRDGLRGDSRTESGLRGRAVMTPGYARTVSEPLLLENASPLLLEHGIPLLLEHHTEES